MRESEVETHLVAKVKALGGEVRKLRWIGRANAPDRLVLLPTKALWMVELKRPGEVPRITQLREHDRLRAFGVNVVVLDSKQAVDQFIKEQTYDYCI